MNGYCEEYDRVVDRGTLEGEQASRWREHLRTCGSCRKQVAADASLREGFAAAPPELSPGFEARLHQRLDRPRSSGRFRPSWRWTLAGYATAATLASIIILSRLPWESLVAPRGLVFALGALVLASPLVLLVPGVRS